MNEPLEIRCQTSYRMTIATDAELRCVIADLKTQVQERDAVLKQALEAATDAHDLFGCVETCSRNNFVNLASEQVESLQKAIAAIKEVLG